MRNAPAVPRPWITLGLCATIIAWFVATSMGWAPGSPPRLPLHAPLTLVRIGARSTPLVGDAAESWRLLTCHFVHTGFVHLAFNLILLFPVGGALEQMVRRRDYVAVLCGVGIAAAVASLLGTPEISAGASGIVFGVLGAATSFGLRHGTRLPLATRRYFGLWVLPFLLIVLIVGFGNPAVDHWSHTGGLISGLGLGWLLPLRDDRGPAILPAVATAVCVVALGWGPRAARQGPPVQYRLADGSELQIPASWGVGYGLLGNLEFSTAGGLVRLATDHSAHQRRDEQWAWYTQRRLAPLVAAGEIDRVEPAIPLPAGPGGAHAVRFRFVRAGTPTVRDVFFLPAAAPLGAASGAPSAPRTPITVVAFETPSWWAGKYAETQRAILGSWSPPRNEPLQTRAAAAIP